MQFYIQKDIYYNNKKLRMRMMEMWYKCRASLSKMRRKKFLGYLLLIYKNIINDDIISFFLFKIFRIKRKSIIVYSIDI